MKRIDLTHTYIDNMPVYPGDSAAHLTQTASVAKEGFTHFDIVMGTHVGTHIDGPLHMLEGGKRIDQFPLDIFFGNGVLIDVRGQKVIDREALAGVDIKAGDIVLLYTAHSKNLFQPDYFSGAPKLTMAFAEELVSKNIKMLGIDMASPDSEPFEIHKKLLSKEILIIENLTNLETLSNAKSFSVIALPLNIKADSSPARVVAVEE